MRSPNRRPCVSGLDPLLLQELLFTGDLRKQLWINLLRSDFLFETLETKQQIIDKKELCIYNSTDIFLRFLQTFRNNLF